MDFLALSESKVRYLIDKLAFTVTIFILSSEKQLCCDSVTSCELRVAFNLHVELPQIRLSNFTKISPLHSGSIFFQMLRRIRKKTLLCHTKSFLFLLSYSLINFCCYETHKKDVG